MNVGRDRDSNFRLRESGLWLTDNTAANSSTTKHGFLPKLSGSASDFLNGSGGWSVPTGSGGTFTIKYKSGDQSISNSTTLTDDDDLKFAIGANETWLFMLSPMIKRAGGAAGVKYTFTVPASAAGFWFDVNEDYTQAAFGASQQTGLQTVFVSYFLTGLVVNSSNTGNVTFQWAQTTTDASAVVVGQYSHMIGFKQ